MAAHCVWLESIDPAANTLTIKGEEGAHAVRSKRLRVGEAVRVVDGAGRTLETRVNAAAGKTLELQVLENNLAPPLRPRLEVWAAAPKGPKAAELVDNLSQAGAAVWRPLKAEHAGNHTTGAKAERLGRVAVEAMKQSGRAWLLELGAQATIEQAVRRAQSGGRVLVADASGERLGPESLAMPDNSGGGDTACTLLVGPEGGFTERELADLRDAGAGAYAFGPHVMRIELAAAIAAAGVLHAAGAS